MADIKMGQLLHRPSNAPIDKTNPLEVQLTGNLATAPQTIFASAMRTTPTSSSTIIPPAGALGCGVYLDIGGVTGTFAAGEGVCLRLRTLTPNGKIGLSTTTKRLTATNSGHHIIIYPNAAIGDGVPSSIADMKVIGLPLASRLNVTIEISGTFADGEGVVCGVVIEWLMR